MSVLLKNFMLTHIEQGFKIFLNGFVGTHLKWELEFLNYGIHTEGYLQIAYCQ